MFGDCGARRKRVNARDAEVLKTVLDELLIHEPTGSAAGVRAIDDDLLLGIERVQSMFQAFEVDRTGDTLGAEHPVSQTIDQFEVPAAISAKAFRLVTPKTIGIRTDSVV
jgi:hypothetical protein